jgi:hypothetical protein
MKKAQAKMMETTMVLVVFFILLAMGLGFYAYTRMTTVSREAFEATQLESIQVAQTINYLPELRCYRQGVVIENCIDYYKLIAFSDLMNQSVDNRLYYFDQFRHSEITLREIYPVSDQVFTIYDYSEGERTGRATHIPITVWYPTTDTNTFAMLTIRYRR